MKTTLAILALWFAGHQTVSFAVCGCGPLCLEKNECQRCPEASTGTDLPSC